MDKLEIKASFSVDDAGTVSGIAWPFGSPDTAGDIIHKGAFRTSAAMPILFEHDAGSVVGIWEAIAETDTGLEAKGRLFLDSVPVARDVHARLRSGRITGLSIGFRAGETKARQGGGRDIYSLHVAEISIVARPSHPAARILEVKTAGDAAPSQGTTMPNENTAPALEIAELETKLANVADEVKSITKIGERLDKIELRLNRPNAANDNSANDNKLELKALASLIRTGTSDEIKTVGGSFETKAASSDSDPAGGYFVLPTVDMTIRTLLTDLSPLRGLAEVVTISSDHYERFYSKGKRGAQWVSERDDRPQDTSRPELIKHSYGVSELYAAPAATRHLLDDASVDVASWLINNATHDFSETEGEAFLDGDGVDGRPTGLLAYETTSEKDFTRAWGKFQYVPAGHASAPTDANLTAALIKLVATLRKPYKGNATFLMNSNTAVRLRTIVDGNGRYLWAPTGNLIEGVEHPLLGYRVEIEEGMPDIGANAHSIAFGDFRQGYVIVDRAGVRVTRDEITQKGRVLFDTYKRVGGGAGDFNAIKFLKVAVA